MSVGTQDVSINPMSSGSEGPSATLTIPTHNFTATNGHQVKSYVLVFKVSLLHDQENGELQEWGVLWLEYKLFTHIRKPE